MKKNENFPRLEMLGKNLTKSQNDLVLYDLLREKNLTQFYVLLKQGYSLDAFVLNCLIDNGFENHVLKALSICGRYDDDVYDFLVLFMGQKEAQAFFIAHNFDQIIDNKFTIGDLVEFEQWNVLIKRESYYALWKRGKREMLFQFYQKTKDYNLRNFLLSKNELDFFVSLGEFSALKMSESGRVKLFELQKWDMLFSLSEAEMKELLYSIDCCNINELYEHIVKHGGENELYRRYEARDWMLISGVTGPFVAAKQWCQLYRGKFYHLIDVEDWLSREGKCSSEIARCAVKQKKWDFLERNDCLRALFFHFRWNRWRRCVVSCLSSPHK